MNGIFSLFVLLRRLSLELFRTDTAISVKFVAADEFGLGGFEEDGFGWEEAGAGGLVRAAGEVEALVYFRGEGQAAGGHGLGGVGGEGFLDRGRA